MTAHTPVHGAPFSGARGGTEPLTWSQHWVVEMIESLAPGNAHLALPITVEVPAGRSLDDVLRAVGALVERHESLRTTIGAGGPDRVQVVSARGAVTVGEHRLATEPDVETTAALIEQMRHPPFAETELPVRATVVLGPGGRPCRIVVLLSHLAADWWGLRLLGQDLVALLADPGAVPPPPAYQLLDRARAERTEKAQRRSAAALQHWRKQLSRFPATMFPAPPRPAATPRFQEAYVESPELSAAVRAAAARLRVTAPTVLLAAVSVALAHRAGIDRCAFTMIVGNRTDRNDRAVAGPFMQYVPLCIEVGARPFPAVAHQAYLEALAAYRHGQYDHRRLADTIADAERSLGTEFDLSCVLNIRDEQQAGPRSAVAIGAPRRPPAGRRSWSGPGFEHENVGLFLDVGGLTECARLYLRTDSTLVPPSEAFAVLEAVERIVARAGDPATDARPAVSLLEH